MIKIEKTSVYNFENAFRGMRNPLSSWDKSDSFFDENNDFVVGELDLNLGHKLCKAGNDHRKFIRQIFVSVDITAPMYWWKEYDTYKIGTVANSTSTMHKIHSKVFEKEDFSFNKTNDNSCHIIEEIVAYLEKERLLYNETKDKAHWWNMIQILPSSYNQMRTCTLNYENLINIYYSRKTHKLDEWHEFCAWISTLPYSEKLILVK